MYGSVVGVIAVAIVVAFVVQNATATKISAAAPVGAVADTAGGVSDQDGMAIPVGDPAAKVKLTVYEDMRCAECKSFETTYTPAYKQLIQGGTLQLLVHPLNLIDANLGGRGSLLGGNALACAQDAGKFEAYHDILYNNQPDEHTDSFSSNATLIALAKQVDGLDGATFESCVNSGKYDGWVRQNYTDLGTATHGKPAAPIFFANGKAFTLPAASSTQAAQAAFIASIDTMAGVNPSASPSVSATAGGASAAPSSAPASPSPTRSAP
jgi:protein-disulfide isomerase